MMCEDRVLDAGDETGDHQQLLHLGDIGIGEGIAGEPAEYASACQCTCRKDMVSNFAGWPVVAQKDDSLFRQKTVHQDNNRVRERSVGCKMGVQSVWLRRYTRRRRECLDQLNDGELYSC